MATTPPPLTPFGGAAPQRGDKATFSGRVDAFVTWLIAVVTQFVALAANVYANAQEAFTSAGMATSAAATAAATANATPWVSGATIQQYAAAISPTDGRTYRRMTAAGSGTTDPSFDPTNYVALSSLPPATYIKVSERQLASAGNPALTSGGTTTRLLNTVDWNDVVGASLATNKVTIPAGTYEVFARAPAYATNGHHINLFNATDSISILAGSSAFLGSSNTSTGDSILTGRFTITSQKAFSLLHYQVGTGTGGQPSGAGSNMEIYAELILKKVA